MQISSRYPVVFLLSAALACSAEELTHTPEVDRATGQTALSASEVSVTAWSSTESPMVFSRAYHTLTALPSGKALAIGGMSRVGNRYEYHGSVEVYDPATRAWSLQGNLLVTRYGHSATLLPSGKVLIVGGSTGSQSGPSVEVYDPATGTSIAINGTWTSHGAHTATRLSSGRVLIAGGASNGNFSAEVYDPGLGTWRAAPMGVPRYGHSATLLLSGKVLISGGYSTSGTLLASAELYDPITGTWSATQPMSAARSGHASTLLPSGKVLVAGGRTSVNNTLWASAEVYDPATGSWAPTGSMAVGRESFDATTLPSGQVLVAAGNYSLAHAELYDSQTGTWSRAGTLATHGGLTKRAALLSSGEVLVSGGDIGPSMSASADVYGPVSVRWSPTGAMTTERSAPTATLLPSGQVLVTGGTQFSNPGNVTSLASAELYDPTTRGWSATASMSESRSRHTATLLPSGQVLVVGGDGPGLRRASAELYDPATGTWRATGSMATARASHAAMLLSSGKVLVVGGAGTSSTSLNSAELYDPATGTWSPAGTLNTGRSYAKLVLLASGQVLVSGGYHSSPSASAEVYDPATQTWSTTGAMTTARIYHSAALLPSGRVLVAGGSNASWAPLASAEVYDPATGLWSPTQSMSIVRIDATALPLVSGKVLVTGGHLSTPTDLASSEWYDEETGSWQSAGRMVQSRGTHGAVRLASGQVLALGGSSGGNSLHSAELFEEAAPPEEPEACEAQGPVLTLHATAELALECQPGATYSDPGAQAVDGCGHPLVVHAYNTGGDSSGPGPNLAHEGTYMVSYAAWDAAGRTANATRTVRVEDRTAPTLALRGPAHMVHACNSMWVDPGVDAMDACYGNLSHTVWRTGEVNGWAEGLYTVRYDVTDSGGNSAATVTRTVEVVDCPW